MRNIALVPAAGYGLRFGDMIPKQYIKIQNLPILLHTLQRLSIPDINHIYVILAPDDVYFDDIEIRFKDFFKKILHQKNQQEFSLTILKKGGQTRAETVFNALSYLFQHNLIANNDWILVHDAVRCCLPISILRKLIQQSALSKHGGILAKKIVDSVKYVNEFQHIINTVDRSALWLAQTPQMFLLSDLLEGFQSVSNMSEITDEASLMEKLGKNPIVVPSDDRNLKITTQDDIHFASFLLTTSLE